MRLEAYTLRGPQTAMHQKHPPLPRCVALDARCGADLLAQSTAAAARKGAHFASTAVKAARRRSLSIGFAITGIRHSSSAA